MCIRDSFWTAFAEFWARYPSQGLRFILAKLTSWIPFSLAEALILSLPVLAAAYIIYSNRALNRSDSPRAFWSCLMPLICAIFLLLSYFCLAFGPCYFRNGLDTVSYTHLSEWAKDEKPYYKTKHTIIGGDNSGATVDRAYVFYVCLLYTAQNLRKALKTGPRTKGRVRRERRCLPDAARALHARGFGKQAGYGANVRAGARQAAFAG